MKISAGQLFVIGFDGYELSSPAQTLLTEFNASGTILFKRNIESLKQVVRLNSQIVKTTLDRPFPAMISVDQEGGRVARLREICSPIPTMRELAKHSGNRTGLIYKMAALMGRELSALGFHLNFAPIADVDSNKDNPIIGDRSFSSDPYAVGEMCAEFIKGLQDSGVAACAKHFPGHGDTSSDSHIELPVLKHDLAHLEKCEFIPFHKAIEAKVATIMTAHVLLPQIDDVPATLSKLLLTDKLRKEFAFEGLIISDDLEMKGIADHYSLRDTIQKGLEAGVDLFLICSDTQMAQEAIIETQKLIDTRQVDPEKVKRALERVADFKAQYLGAVSEPDLEYAQNIVRSKPHTQLIESIA